MTEEKKPSSVSEQIQNKFLEERKIFLWGEVSDKSARDLTEKLLFLESNAPGKEITFYINSPGGSITAGMAIFDTMQLISSPIAVVVTGMAASMGAFLLAAGTKGKRLCLPNSRVMIHQPLGGVSGQATDIEIHAKEILALKNQLNKILSQQTGQSLKTIAKDTDRDNFMSAQDALKYGIVDNVIEKRE